MRRKSFLRNSSLNQIIEHEWVLPALGKHKIGFGICAESGIVMQSPSPNPKDIQRYYKYTATYNNPGREGRPSIAKVIDLNRLLHIVIDVVGYMPDSVFQVGCSDGYTLFRFKETGVKTINGIDPSIASHEVANKLYGIDTIIGSIENYNDFTQKYDLIVLTHVLEHLFNPVDCLKQCSLMQKDGAWLLIEVPLFERLDLFPPGLLTLEHLNYFSEGTIIEAITMSGYVPRFIGKYFNNHDYPVITVVCRKYDKIRPIQSEDYLKNKRLLNEYILQESTTWGKIEKKIKCLLSKMTKVYIYGAGIHTSQLLAFTDLEKYLNIVSLLDSSPTKWGIQLGELKCYNPNDINIQKGDYIIISSFASEEEIFNQLSQHRQNGVNILKLYGDDQ